MSKFFALQQKRFMDLDIENLVEEIESLSRSDKRALRSYLRVLLMHLLKWQYRAGSRSRSWQVSIRNTRREIGELIVDSPGLKPYAPEVLETFYQNSRGDAADETGLSVEVFPVQCPFSIEEVLNVNFL